MLFHLVPDDMQGSTLYPLNSLKDKYPDVYTKKIAKYQGREWVCERVIPHLNCRWNDVIHLCPVHPRIILDKLREIGYVYPKERFFEIDIDRLKPDNIVIMTYNRENAERQFHQQSPDSIPGIDELPSATVEYFKECFTKKERFMLFGYIPHVLYMDSIDINDCPVVEV